jgi:hypothetical protein
LERRGDEKFPAASTIKLAMLCAAMERQQKGEIGYDEARTLTKEDRQNGTGLLQNYREGTPVGLREMRHLMITVSDNTAASLLGQWLGTETINAWLDRHGLKHTRLLIPWPICGTVEHDMTARSSRWEPVRQWGMGVTTPNEIMSKTPPSALSPAPPGATITHTSVGRPRPARRHSTTPGLASRPAPLAAAPPSRHLSRRRRPESIPRRLSASMISSAGTSPALLTRAGRPSRMRPWAASRPLRLR